MAKVKGDSPESVIASADAANSRVSGREYIGNEASNNVSIPTNAAGFGGTAVPKAGKSVDPTAMAHPSRQGVERNGATYSVIAGINKPVDPAVSGKTQANGRILAPAINRSGSFWDGSNA